MTKNEIKKRLIEVLNNDKNGLIMCSNLYSQELQEQKRKNKTTIEKFHHTNGQICYINQLLNYINKTF